MPIILDGKKVAHEIENDLIKRIEGLKKQKINPKVYVFISNDESSKVYVKNKIKAGERIGIEVIPVHANSSKDILPKLSFNNIPFIIQEPSNLSRKEISSILERCNKRDVDGFSAANIGNLSTGFGKYITPCTPKGIIRLLHYYNLPTTNKNVVMIGRSNIVGKPMAMELTALNNTVTLCHSRTDFNYLISVCENADMIISATGKQDILQGWKAKANQVLIDVGINRNKEGKLCGDFSASTIENCYAYTPIPGGVGPMTVAMFLENVIEIWEDTLFWN